MTDPDFRALCAELLQPLAEYDGAHPYHEHRALITRARAVLARWGHPATPPAPEPGEVAELVDLLQCEARWKEEVYGNCAVITPAELRRVATLLQQLSAPAPVLMPVPVSERLPKYGDCDAEGRCWWFTPPACGPHKIRPGWTLDSEVLEGDSHWLPASAIPLPKAGEVEA
jgi:hypothetical protein